MHIVDKNIDYIAPISDEQRSEVRNLALNYITLAGQIYNKSFSAIPITFDLRGKCAGMYQRKGRERRIRFNPWLFAKYYKHSNEQTVPHEVAHYITDCLWRFRRVKPHGKEWQSVMQTFGVEPKVTGSFDLTGIPTKQCQRFSYSCGCKINQISLIRHRRVQSGQAEYRCKDCRQLLKAASE
jgi:SprT protein